MSAQREKVRQEARELPAEEQHILAVELIDSAWGEYELPDEVRGAWDAEIAKRAEDVRTGKVPLIPWEQAKADLAKEFGWDPSVRFVRVGTISTSPR